MIFMKRRKMNEKGLVGPLGEDFPSLIPIVFAFLIFFGVFGSAYMIFENNNQVFDKKLKALQISRTMKENSYLLADSFETQCIKAQNIPANFIVGLVEYKLDQNGEIIEGDQIAYNPYEDGSYDLFANKVDASGLDSKYICTSNGEIDPNFRPPRYNAIMYEFPVILQLDATDQPDIRLMRLVVSVW